MSESPASNAKKKYPTFRPVRTVGALARQLANLPANLPLAEALKVTVYNAGPCPEGWDSKSWGPRVGVEENYGD